MYLCDCFIIKNLFQIMAGELPGAQVEVWYPRGVVDGAIGYRENICGRVAGHSWTVGCHRRPFWGCQKKNKFTPGCIAELRDCDASSLRLFVLVYFNFTIGFELKFGQIVTSYTRKLVYIWWSLKWRGWNSKIWFSVPQIHLPHRPIKIVFRIVPDSPDLSEL